MNRFNSSSRISLAILSMIICALLVNVCMLAQNIIFPEKTIQDIDGYLNSFTTTLKEELPRRGVVGYVDGLADDELTTPRSKYLLDEKLATTKLYLARYSLAPIILVRSLNYPFIVGNFVELTTDMEAYRRIGLIPVRDFGNGVVLFRRASP